MRYQLLLCTDHGAQSGPADCAAAPAEERRAGSAAGTAGLQWLWGLVELKLSQAEPDSAA
jgi:hypothetical protein